MAPSARLAVGVAACLLALLGPAVTTALYADQAGVVDWAVQRLGAPLAGVAWADAKSAYVASNEGVLASLSTRSNEIAWRRVLDEGESLSRR